MGGCLCKELCRDKQIRTAVSVDSGCASPRRLPRVSRKGVTRLERTGKKFDHQFKFVMVGDSKTGKSALLQRLRPEGSFLTSYVPTIGVDFCIKGVEIDDLRLVLQVWEIGSDKRFRFAAKIPFYKRASGAMIVFGVNSRDSFDNVQHWIDIVQQYTPEGTPIVLVGNKCDMKEERQVSYLDAKQFADERGLLYIDVSAKDDTNTELAVMSLLTTVFDGRA